MALRLEDVEENNTLNSQIRAIERENGEDGNSQGSESYCSRTLRYVQRGVMFVIVLACVTLSKLTLVLLTDKLRMLTVGKKQMESNQSWDGERVSHDFFMCMHISCLSSTSALPVFWAQIKEVVDEKQRQF